MFWKKSKNPKGSAVGWSMILNFIAGLLMLTPFLLSLILVLDGSYSTLKYIIFITIILSTIGFWYTLFSKPFKKDWFCIALNISTITLYVAIAVDFLPDWYIPKHISTLYLIQDVILVLLFCFPLITSIFNLYLIRKFKE